MMLGLDLVGTREPLKVPEWERGAPRPAFLKSLLQGPDLVHLSTYP